MRRLIVSLVPLLLACGGSNPPSGPRLLSVGGTYQTAVTLIGSTCPNTQVQTFPTTVVHTPGTTTVQLQHAGSTYNGTVANDGTFTTPGQPFTIGGVNYLVAIAGKFEVQAMTATVTVQVVQTTPCDFSARWSGPKQGTPNVFP